MRRILVLFVAAMLLTAPAFAATSASQSATTVYRGVPQGKSDQSIMQGNINQTQMKDSDVINVGKDNTIKIGSQSNSGGKMSNNVNQTQVSGSKIVNVGQGNTTEIGTQSNN